MKAMSDVTKITKSRAAKFGGRRAMLVVCACLAPWFGPTSVPAAEMQLRSQCETTKPLVSLGDIAEIAAVDSKEAQTLAAIELFPVPPAGQQRYVRLREIQDLLAQRGVKLAEHRFSGSSQVMITRASAGGPRHERPLSSAVVKKAHRQVCDAIVEYLGKQAPGRQWSVEVALEPDQARRVSGSVRGIAVRGGRAPWTGSQQFEITAQTEGGPARIPVVADVSLPPAVVVAARSLPRGALVSAADVRLERVPVRSEGEDQFHSVEDILGQEVTRMISAGATITRRAVRPPLLVRRGDVVTLQARSAGICVRTTARARQDGSLGDLIAVESMLDRKTFHVRVSGMREAEIFAQALQAGRSAARSPSLAGRR